MKSVRPLLFIFAALLTAGWLGACERTPPADDEPAPDSDLRIKADWSAWVSKMPPGPASFHVEGTLHLPHAGFDASLTPRSPQGFNPHILMLDLNLTEREGMSAQVLTDLPVKYILDPYDGDYEQVHILYPNGDSVFLELTVAY